MSVTDILQAARTHRDSIIALDVYHVDDHASTAVPIKPEDLETRQNVFHHHTTDAKLIDAALNTVEASGATAHKHGAELRWKMSFRDRDGKALLEVWHESFEAYGRIGATEVKFAHDGILKFLHQHFASQEKTLSTHK